MAPRKRNRPCIGLLVDRIDDTYQNELMLRIAEAARRHDTSVLCFAGAPLEPSLSEVRNRIYELAGPDNVDAIILSAGSLENKIGSARLLDYLDRFRPLPICSIGVQLPEMASIFIDNAAGTRQVVEHLIAVHGRRRIAFIRGPAANDEADQRYRGYQRALLDAQLQPDSDLVVDGDFLPASGAQAVSTLLDERSLDPDAIVAANDLMALGALEALLRRGILVPESISVVGFDDIEDGRVAQRPLTTVRQPLATLGERAVSTALAQLAGERPHKRVLVETEMVARRSCGCRVQRQLYEVSSPQSAHDSAPQASLSDKRDQIVTEVLQSASELAGRAWAEQLVGAFVDQLCAKDHASFAAAVDDVATTVLDTHGDLDPLHQALTELRRRAVPALLDSPGLVVQAETLLHEGRLLLTHAVERRETKRRLQVEELTRTVGQLAQALLGISADGELSPTVEGFLPRLSMPSCHVTRFSPGQGRSMLELLVTASRETADADPALLSQPIPVRHLLPAELLPEHRPYSFVVEPLYYANEQPLGLALFEMGPTDGTVYELLRTQLASVLHTLQLSKQLGEHTAEHARVMKRAVEVLEEVRRIQRSRLAQAQEPAEPTVPDEPGGPVRILEMLDGLLAECLSASGDELDTLRPPPKGKGGTEA
ncbi:MAG: substrate-binding domain-containing protein [Polyangiaceae bacterium]|nr:substrate-binding domain-containing protein [Polyangiaceae bacterium]